MGKVVKVSKEEIIKNRKEIKSAIEASEKIENTIHTNEIEALEVVTKNNIIIFALENSEDSSAPSVCRELKKLLDVEVHVSDINKSYRRKNAKKLMKLQNYH
ncbi:hypothetical protein JTB14_037085 [Gonioctena quinquepunctata]|nr:hypothetical protein JTB14_037085 [Gonioctena quinquepunctata]